MIDLLRAKVELFNNPIEVDVESQPSHLQQELCELESDPFLLSRKNERYDAFWKFVLLLFSCSPLKRLCTKNVLHVRQHVHLLKCFFKYETNKKTTYGTEPWMPVYV